MGTTLSRGRNVYVADSEVPRLYDVSTLERAVREGLMTSRAT